MKRLIPAVAIVLAWAAASWAAAPAPLTTLRTIHALNHAEADQNLPVAFEATVTYARGYDLLLFVQDNGVGIYVRTLTDHMLQPGDRILIKGTTQASFRTFVLGKDISLIRHDSMPKPMPATYEQMLRTERDCLLVTFRGVVRAVDSNTDPARQFTSMRMVMPGGALDVVVNTSDPNQLKGLLDSEVEVSGTVSAHFEGMSQVGVIFNVPSPANFKFIRRVPLITLPAIHTLHTLGNLGTEGGLPVAFQAAVTYYRGSENMLFVQDGGEGIYVRSPNNLGLTPGDRVLIRGKSYGAFRPWILSDSVTRAEHGPLPKPEPANYRELIRAQHDCQLISVRAVVRAADPAWGANGPTYLQLQTDEGYIDAILDNDDPGARKLLLDADAEVTGVATGKLDGMNQLTGIKLYIPSLASIKILKRAGSSPQSLPITPMQDILSDRKILDTTPRVRVRGVITYYQPSSFAVLQDGLRSLRIKTQSNVPLRIGDLADATGFPDVQDGFLTLSRGEIQDTGLGAAIQPLQTDWLNLATSHSIFGLVSIQGKVMTEIREASQDEYVLASDGNLYSAIFHHPNAASHIPLPPMKQIAPGSMVRVTGICLLKNADPYNGQVPFDLLLRSFDDIAVVVRPSLINMRNLLILLGVLIVAVFAFGARGWVLERNMRRQTVVMKANAEAEAELERRRSSILEDINGNRPLAEIIEEIAGMVSFGLKGVPCWCETADGAILGFRPPEKGLRVVCKAIAARSGPPLGVIHAAFDPLAPQEDKELETLSVGGRLVTLAMESRQLHTELTRRSEFDLLTDIPNRFALEKFMSAQIEAAGRTGRTLGLIYIDLDKFKPINDIYPD